MGLISLVCYAPSWATLLALQPGTKAVKVEYVPTREFFGSCIRAILRRHRSWSRSRIPRFLGRMTRRSRNHLIPAYDTSSIAHSAELRLRCIRITLIHVTRRSAVTNEVAETHDKGASRDVYIPDNIQWKSVECQNEHKERQISYELEKIFEINNFSGEHDTDFHSPTCG